MHLRRIRTISALTLLIMSLVACNKAPAEVRVVFTDTTQVSPTEITPTTGKCNTETINDPNGCMPGGTPRGF